jgi:SAM-dependent methyltransferase
VVGEEPRYDGWADWYVENLGPLAGEMTDVIRRLMGPGSGRCLDLGCGPGFHIPTLVGLGWTVTGVDISEDQLRLARERVGPSAELILTDATSLPWADDSFDAVLSAFTHTDVEDFRSVLREAVRVLRPGGRLVYLGPHPCFVGPHSRFIRGEGMPELHQGYQKAGRYTDGPGISPGGLRARVGAIHLPLGEFLQTFLDAGLVVERVEEPERREYPVAIALRARR